MNVERNKSESPDKKYFLKFCLLNDSMKIVFLFFRTSEKEIFLKLFFIGNKFFTFIISNKSLKSNMRYLIGDSLKHCLKEVDCLSQINANFDLKLFSRA